MRMDIVEGGFKELSSAAEVEVTMAQPGTTLLFINSVCGCSARTARPGVKEAVAASAKKPAHLVNFWRAWRVPRKKGGREHFVYEENRPKQSGPDPTQHTVGERLAYYFECA